MDLHPFLTFSLSLSISLSLCHSLYLTVSPLYSSFVIPLPPSLSLSVRTSRLWRLWRLCLSEDESSKGLIRAARSGEAKEPSRRAVEVFLKQPQTNNILTIHPKKARAFTLTSSCARGGHTCLKIRINGESSALVTHRNATMSPTKESMKQWDLCSKDS